MYWGHMDNLSVWQSMFYLCCICTAGIQTSSKHMGTSKYMGVSKHMGVSTHIQGASKHTGGSPNIWGHPSILGASKHMGHPNIQGGVSKHMGCPNIWGIQTFRGHSNKWGHPNIQGASKHMGVNDRRWSHKNIRRNVTKILWTGCNSIIASKMAGYRYGTNSDKIGKYFFNIGGVCNRLEDINHQTIIKEMVWWSMSSSLYIWG